MSIDTITCYGWFGGSSERLTQVSTYGWYDPGVIGVDPSLVLIADQFFLGRTVEATFGAC